MLQATPGPLISIFSVVMIAWLLPFHPSVYLVVLSVRQVSRWYKKHTHLEAIPGCDLLWLDGISIVNNQELRAVSDQAFTNPDLPPPECVAARCGINALRQHQTGPYMSTW